MAIKVIGGNGRGCLVCGRRDWHIHANHEWERARAKQQAQLRLW